MQQFSLGGKEMSSSAGAVTAKDVHEYLRGLGSAWVDPDNTVDTFKAGSPDTRVESIAVAWKAHTWALREAHEKGCNLFVCHEPLYYDHHDKDDSYMRYPEVAAKHAWLDETGMAVVRCHDVWDQVPEIGITDSWAKLLGLGQALPESHSMHKVYDVSGKTAWEVAQQVAAGVKKLGQECVQFIGDRHKPVSRVAIGTGAGTPFMRYLDDLNADVAVVSDDGYTFWREGALAIDLSVPLIVVNHCVSEDYGMVLLAERLREVYPGIPVHHIPQATTVRAVRQG